MAFCGPELRIDPGNRWYILPGPEQPGKKMAAKSGLTRMTLRVSKRQRETLDKLKAATREATASKALWRAAVEYPQLRQRVASIEGQLGATRALIRALAAAETAAADARTRASAARESVIHCLPERDRL